MGEDETPLDIAKQILIALEEIRPALQIDGGDVQLVAIEGNDVRLRFVGPYVDCLSTVVLLRMGLERKLREQIPNIGKITADNPF